MKKLLFLLVLAALPAWPCGASEEGAGQVKFDAETGKLSIRLLMHEWEKELSPADAAGLEDGLCKSMQDHLKENQRLETARQNSREYFRTELVRIYDAKLQELFQNAKLPWTQGQNIIPDAEKQKFLKAFESKYFRKTFEAARQRLVKEQKVQLFQKVYPSEAELEKYSDAQLVPILERRFLAGAGVVLLEENLAIARRELIEPVIRSGRKQQQLQLHLAQTLPVPRDLWNAEEVSRHLSGIIPQAAAKELASDEKPFAVFAATLQAIRKRTESLPAERVIAALPENLSRAEYLTMLQTRPQQHLTKKSSRETLHSDRLPGWVQSAMETCGMPDELKKTLVRDQSFQAAVNAEFDRRFAALQPVREEFAAGQLNSYWKALVTGEWQPELAETEQYVSSGSQTVPKLSAQPSKDENLLEETRKLREEKVRAALALEAARLEKQQTCVIEIYAQVLAAMREKQHGLQAGQNRFLAFFFADKTISLDTVIKAYQDMVSEQCAPPLFPSVLEEIEARSRAILLEVTKPEEKKEERSQPDPEKMDPEKLIELRLSGGSRVKVSTGNWTRHYPAESLDAEEIAAVIKRQMAKDSGKNKVALVVEGKKIYYHTVAELKQALEKALNCPVEDALMQ